MSDEYFMGFALEQARQAAALGEVPVGAVIVWQGGVIATGKNSQVNCHDPTAHAEIMALRNAAQVLGNYRLYECELFVTLEPCAMCSGAILNARLKRIVFGAFETKTGAAGSVVNLFAQQRLNHRTQLLGGVLAGLSRSLMRDFFQQRRADQRALAVTQHPLRDDSLRTPDAAFENLTGHPWAQRYRNDLVALDGLRLHYLDEPTVAADCDGTPTAVTYLCLHSHSAWSYQFRKLSVGWLQEGHRVIAPDLIGFGRSDKPKKETFHTLERHCRILSELVERLDLRKIVLVLPGQHDSVSLLGMMLPMGAPLRYHGLLTINMNGLLKGTEISIRNGWPMWSETIESLTKQGGACGASRAAVLHSDDEMIKARTASFPHQSFCAGVHAFANIPKLLNSPESNELCNRAEQFWQQRFEN